MDSLSSLGGIAGKDVASGEDKESRIASLTVLYPLFKKKFGWKYKKSDDKMMINYGAKLITVPPPYSNINIKSPRFHNRIH